MSKNQSAVLMKVSELLRTCFVVMRKALNIPGLFGGKVLCVHGLFFVRRPWIPRAHRGFSPKLLRTTQKPTR